MSEKYKYAPHPDKDRGARNFTQRGIAAIEFALVFPAFFILLYGIITYVLIFLAQQSLALAAEEGARAALRYATTDSLRLTNACSTATQLVSWLGSGTGGVSIATCSTVGPATCTLPVGSTARCITVNVSYPYGSKPLVPLLLGSMMSVAVPTTLASSATVQID
ncbi:Flp pilus assembly protein TadG [Collimonas sp. PA-H2]|uniref:TadE/TadG family type IV pilus assembly protein n=1 Tax=Collimonas sp. PA-H2 TaxID=1881062 RepID=UPI000BF96537|nr:TadE/TadG family type IV pilus assembly protein [Collimonas sp. PA-H2]PFH10757.1 Flp pilus assembly protein TadG [Collimonas sp. PA-H2]